MIKMNDDPSYVYIKPPIFFDNIRDNISIYSYPHGDIETDCPEKFKLSYIQIDFPEGFVIIHPDKLVLIEKEQKVKIATSFCNFLFKNFKFTNNVGEINMNNYFKFYLNKTSCKLELGLNKNPSPDWAVFKNAFNRHMSLKAFW